METITTSENSLCNNNGMKVPGIASLDELIAHLRDTFSSENVNIEYVQALMSSYKSNISDWQKFAKFDENSYTKNLVDEGNGKYNLMLVCWGGGHGSPIHGETNN